MVEKVTYTNSTGTTRYQKTEISFNKKGNYTHNISYDENGGIKRKNIYTYNSFGDLLSVENNKNQIWRKGILNDERRVIEQHDISTHGTNRINVIIYFDYDSIGRVIKEKEVNLALGDSVIPPKHKYYKYLENDIIEYTDIRYWGLGKSMKLSTEVIQYNKDFRPLKECTKYEEGGNCTWYEYHENGQNKKETYTSKFGNGSIYNYDEEGNKISFFAFDKDGNDTTKERLKMLPHLAPHEINYEYGEKGNWTKKYDKDICGPFYYEREIIYFEK